MNYQEVIDYVYNLRRFGDMKLGLERIKFLLEKVENPEQKLKVIHVGGTNGKGSTAAMVASILRAAGFKVGVYTSPHLSSYRERIVVDNQKISEEEIIKLFDEFKPIIDEMIVNGNQPTFPEVTTAIAFKYFYDQGVDYAVVEVGLGGRLDATNVVNPLVTVITNIGLEHTDILGNSIEEIAAEKAGIIKDGIPLVTATEEEKAFSVFKRICEENKSRIIRIGKDVKFEKKRVTDLDGQFFDLDMFGEKINDLFIPMLGDFQIINAATAVCAAMLSGCDIEEEEIREGLKNVKWPGRLEIVQKNPLVVLDCAKDPLAMRKLVDSIKKDFKYGKLISVVSISKDKKIDLMIRNLAEVVDKFVFTRHGVQNRAVELEILEKEANKYSKPFVSVESVKEAVRKAIDSSDKEDMILITGSVFTVAEAREIWFEEVDLRWGRELNEVKI
jgi:dihydrofolate synthase/folylpolyglutamate synthase